MKNPKTKLYIFDFDETLFKSPRAPKGYKGAYWDDIRSLVPPVLPEKVPISFYKKVVLKKAFAVCESKDSICAVVTGRGEHFEDRLKQMFRQIKFSPDYLYTRPVEEAVLSYKLRVVEGLLKEHENVYKLVVYEDNEDQLYVFRALAKEQGLEYEPHHVTS